MGYFANGEIQDRYEHKYCERCIHHIDTGGQCPVMFLHWLWNYDAVGANADKAKEVALSLLIPMDDEGIHNKQCAMFYRQGE